MIEIYGRSYQILEIMINQAASKKALKHICSMYIENRWTWMKWSSAVSAEWTTEYMAIYGEIQQEVWIRLSDFWIFLFHKGLQARPQYFGGGARIWPSKIFKWFTIQQEVWIWLSDFWIFLFLFHKVLQTRTFWCGARISYGHLWRDAGHSQSSKKSRSAFLTSGSFFFTRACEQELFGVR